MSESLTAPARESVTDSASVTAGRRCTTERRIRSYQQSQLRRPRRHRQLHHQRGKTQTAQRCCSKTSRRHLVRRTQSRFRRHRHRRSTHRRLHHRPNSQTQSHLDHRGSSRQTRRSATTRRPCRRQQRQTTSQAPSRQCLQSLWRQRQHRQQSASHRLLLHMPTCRSAGHLRRLQHKRRLL
jgi:hypothetical protein